MKTTEAPKRFQPTRQSKTGLCFRSPLARNPCLHDQREKIITKTGMRSASSELQSPTRPGPKIKIQALTKPSSKCDLGIEPSLTDLGGKISTGDQVVKGFEDVDSRDCVDVDRDDEEIDIKIEPTADIESTMADIPDYKNATSLKAVKAEQKINQLISSRRRPDRVGVDIRDPKFLTPKEKIDQQSLRKKQSIINRNPARIPSRAVDIRILGQSQPILDADTAYQIDINFKLQKLARKKARIALEKKQAENEARQLENEARQMEIEARQMEIEDEEAELMRLDHRR